MEVAPEHAELRRDLGLVLLELGEEDRAQAAFSESLRIDPGRFDSARRLGVLQLEDGEFEEAARTLEGAARHVEDDAELFHELVRAYEATLETEKIESAVRRGLRADPAHPGLLTVQGRMLGEAGDHTQAAEAFEKPFRQGGGPPRGARWL